MGVRRWGIAACGMLVLAALAGCTSISWETQGDERLGTPHASPAPERTFADASPVVEPSATAEPLRNDLAEGSLTRELRAGPVTVDVTYWSEVPLEAWTSGAVKPLSLSLTTTVAPDDGQRIYLQRASMSVVPGGGEPLPAEVDVAAESPGYLVRSPYSYSQVFPIGAVPEGTKTVAVQLRYELLVQTRPGADEYAKQTATDSLTLVVVG